MGWFTLASPPATTEEPSQRGGGLGQWWGSNDRSAGARVSGIDPLALGMVGLSVMENDANFLLTDSQISGIE